MSFPPQCPHPSSIMSSDQRTTLAAAGARNIARLLHLNARPDRNPIIPPALPPAAKKKGFASAAFRGLGCASSSSSQAFAPAAAAVRSSADWQGKRPRRRRNVKQKHRKDHNRSPVEAAAADVWCAPGLAFAADAPVDCVVSAGGRGRSDSERPQRERSYVERHGIDGRGGSNQERMPSYIDSPSVLEAPLFGSDSLPSGRPRQLRGYRRSPGGLEEEQLSSSERGLTLHVFERLLSRINDEQARHSDKQCRCSFLEIMMFQTRHLLGAVNVYDQYQDLRLDVDGMSYEELLELGNKIGYVSNGLREEEILCCLRKSKHNFFTAAPFCFSEIERKCSICQEDYEVNDEMGRLYCGHSYHIYCIKQWLLQKNVCPVCKYVVTKG